MLSNTATPKYYKEFRDEVLRGHIPISREIEMQMNRVDERIRNKGLYYDSEAVEGYIRFCENELTLTDGAPLELLPSFKLWAEDLLGWYYFVEKSVYERSKDGRPRLVRKKIKRRLVNKQYIILGRGGAKTLYDASMHAYVLVVDGTTTNQIAVAPTMRQADETLSPFRTAIAVSRGPLFKFLTEGSIQNTTGDKAKRPKLSPTKLGIQNFITNSVLEIRPMSIDKLQGLRPKISTIDEWLSGDTKEDVVGALEQGAAKVDDWIIILTSSEGTVRNGIGDSIKMELQRILKGEYNAIHTSIWWYKLDDIKEVAYPDLWLKANPNLGATVSYETYQDEVERAENNPVVRNDTLAKRFGIPMEGYTYFFTYEETLRHKRRSFWGMNCAMGADLSRGDDFCSFTFLFPLKDGAFGIKTLAYISELTFSKLNISMREKYQSFIDEGTLRVMEGTVLNIGDEIYPDVCQFIEEQNYIVLSFGYDPFNAREFVEQWIRENSDYATEVVRQGYRTESVPLGDLKNLAEERLLLFDQEIFSYTMGNCIVLEDTNGNRKLYKRRYEEKIDCVAALMDAYVSYTLHKEEFE